MPAGNPEGYTPKQVANRTEKTALHATPEFQAAKTLAKTEKRAARGVKPTPRSTPVVALNRPARPMVRAMKVRSAAQRVIANRSRLAFSPRRSKPTTSSS